MGVRRTFLVRVWEDGSIVAEDPGTRERIRLSELDALPGAIATWLSKPELAEMTAPDGDE